MTFYTRWKRQLRQFIYEYPRKNEADLSLHNFFPRSMLQVTTTQVSKPAFSAIDAHAHLGKWLSPHDEWMAPNVKLLLEQMNEAGVSKVVNLDGRWEEELDENISRYDAAHPGKFATFAHLDWRALLNQNSTDLLISQLHRARDQGAKGVKIWKDLGLSVRDADDSLVLISDSRLTDVLSAAGELKLPIMIHTADPKTYFNPLDRRNEKYEQMATNSHLQYFGKSLPNYSELHSALRKAVLASPGTQFIGAHVGGSPENLQYVSSLLDEIPNYSVDIAGRLSEIGRQPKTFRSFAEKYADRILFGCDYFPFSVEGVRKYFRFLETDDEYFPYGLEDQPPGHGRWNIYGTQLDEGSLKKIYCENASRLIEF
jgi:predicted TIM-barrel fold metal-dependent hydrolase